MGAVLNWLKIVDCILTNSVIHRCATAYTSLHGRHGIELLGLDKLNIASVTEVRRDVSTLAWVDIAWVVGSRAWYVPRHAILINEARFWRWPVGSSRVTIYRKRKETIWLWAAWSQNVYALSILDFRILSCLFWFRSKISNFLSF